MNELYKRNLIKEKLQDYILNFVYNDKQYRKLIFTGGTCLRKIYNIPRLSEDLDFDVSFQFSIADFTQNLKRHLTKREGFKNAEFKIAGNKRTIFVKFLQENKEKIFVRCDFSEADKGAKTEVNPYYAEKFNFFILSYDLPALFTHKIEAFLQRSFFKGKAQNVSFKGRDLYDIVWFIQLSSRTGFQLKPDWKRIEKDLKLDADEVVEKIVQKVSMIKKKDAALDLSAFLESEQELTGFADNYKAIIENKLKLLV